MLKVIQVKIQEQTSRRKKSLEKYLVQLIERQAQSIEIHICRILIKPK